MLRWNYDIEKSKIAIKAQKCFLNSLENLNEVSMLNSITSKTKRTEMRALYEANDAKKLLLTQKDIDPDSDDSLTDDTEGELEVDLSADD